MKTIAYKELSCCVQISIIAALIAFVEMRSPNFKTTPRLTNNSTAFLCRSQTVVAKTPQIEETALLFY